MATENLPNWLLRGSRSTKGVVPKSAQCKLKMTGPYWTTLEMFVRTSISGRARLSPAVPQTVDVDGLDIAPETRPSKFLHFPLQNQSRYTQISTKFCDCNDMLPGLDVVDVC